MHPNETLRRLAASVTPTVNETAAAEKHFETITTRLEQSFGASRFIRIGSHARGTAIKALSDIDLLAVLPRKAARWGESLVTPRTFLSKVGGDLQSRYRTTSVRADGQAIVLNFSGGTHSVDVVPGIFEGMNGNRPMYLIPGTRDQWISTSPETHDVIFNEANKRSGGKLGGLARLIKVWKYGRENPIPLSSFYTDLVLATTDLAAGPKTYAQCLRDFFAKLVERDVRGLRDPGGVAGIISASSYQGQLDRLYAAAQFAREHADSALYAERIGKPSEAIRQWGIVFNRAL
jgi:predicted nucleotidyltransferase